MRISQTILAYYISYLEFIEYNINKLYITILQYQELTYYEARRA